MTNIQEAYLVAVAASELQPQRPKDWRYDLVDRTKQAKTYSITNDDSIKDLPQLPNNWSWHLSTPNVPGIQIGTQLKATEEKLPRREGFRLPYRFIALPKGSVKIKTEEINELVELANEQELAPMDLQQLGIMEEDHLIDEERQPIIRGRGSLSEALAVCEMLALHQQVPFRRDIIQKVLEGQFRRDKGLSLELMAGLCEMLGMSSQLAKTASAHINSVEGPAVLFLDDVPVIFYGMQRGRLSIAHPHKGIQKLTPQEFSTKIGEQFRFMLPRRVSTTPTSRFGWNWFTPLLKKYKTSLILVFVASLLSQMFGLAIPLLIQQIIDKVLSQGNLSSLNVLGTAMIVMALFQGLLQALRTYIFVDTTDRMDLTLGSSVIDRLLALPLSYFERRPVGELSQRLGELNTIRSFLTGTALISVLNIIFAVIYLGVMFAYSPLLSGVALSTFPLYIFWSLL